MKSICLYTRNTRPTGIKVILENIRISMNGLNMPIVNNISDAVEFDNVLPYGLLEAIDLLNTDKSKCCISLMIDATSLIDISQFKYFKEKGILSYREKYIELIRYYYHSWLEKKVFKNYNDIVIVSYSDKEYFSKKFAGIFDDKLMVVQNGVDLPRFFKRNRVNDGKIVLGFLNSWGDGTGKVPREIRCFLEYVWTDVQKINHNIILKMFGRGMSSKQKEYFKKYDKVIGVGDTKSLNDYFNQIDINLIIVPKHAGILNKMLDGFAYKCPTICEPHNVKAFKALPDCYYTYSDASSLVASVMRIMHNYNEALEKSEIAYKYIESHHNWRRNYEPLSKKIMGLLVQ